MEQLTDARVKQIRELYLKEVKKLLIGPGSENITTSLKNEIISESPISRYVSGILYKKKDRRSNEQNDELISDGDLDEQPLYLDNSFKPSSMGLSFYCSSESGIIPIKVSTSFYTPIKDVSLTLTKGKYGFISETLKKNKTDIFEFNDEKFTIGFKDFNYTENRHNQIQDLLKQITSPEIRDYIKKLEFINSSKNKKGKCFFRNNFEKLMKIDIAKVGNYSKEIVVNETLQLKLDVIIKSALENSSIKSITVVLENVSKEDFFQSKIIVDTNRGSRFYASEDVEKRKLKSRNLKVGTIDKEEVRESLMYRNKRTFAFGRGVSATWDASVEHPGRLETEYIPTYESIPMSFTIPELSPEVLRPQSYIDDDKEKQVGLLRSFIEEYDIWIKKTEKKIQNLDTVYKDCALCNIDKCHKCSMRMKKTVSLLENNSLAFETFKLANEVILLQRVERRENKENYYKKHNYDEVTFSWRPFQLAFILLTFESLFNESSDERDTVDLLWVSTGGGKTEAYLFAIAATIIQDRLSREKENAKFGVTVIMRYTLRLLTTQQFSRAAAMICALEYMRMHRSDLGNEPISLGLWIGNKSTPGTKEEARKLLKDMGGKDNIDLAIKENQFQVLECPWCHQANSIIPENNNFGSAGWGYKLIRRSKSKFDMQCLNKDCPFCSGLPINVIDETIYRNRPTLLFSTVDKFAQVPLKKGASNLFGSFVKGLSRPKLVIQDELHLISGPLGSIVGLYESGFDYILKSSGSRPKYIASTATIKNSDDQIRNLFNRKVFQFPPDGIDQADNFFVKEDESKSGRKYVGVMGTGKTQVTTEVRLLAAMIECIKMLNLSPEEEELYWTIVNYFNSIRELGKTSSLLRDDVHDQLKKIGQRNCIPSRELLQNNAVELTSRIKSGEIPSTLERLSVSHSDGDKEAIDTLIATNMFSVGVDVGRLNNMMVVGQPKLTSEYIQATSRVGREKLGIIFTLYNSMRSRDRSHYETFTSYHQSLYKYVEPTSVTPFSIPAMKKAIAAVIVAMVRNTIPEMKEDNRAGLIIGHESELQQVRSFLLERIKSVDSINNMYFDDAKSEIDCFIGKWIDLAEEHEELVYYQYNPDKGPALLTSFDNEARNQSIPVMGSMRDVDKQSRFNFFNEVVK